MTTNGITGRWQLDSWTTRDTNGRIAHPFGEGVQGNVIYTSGGWVSVHVAAQNRPPLPLSILGAIGTEAEQLAAYSTYVAYSGHYHVQDDVIIHDVVTSLYPNWAGIRLRRTFELSGDRLTLSMPPGEAGTGVSVHELRWRREE